MKVSNCGCIRRLSLRTLLDSRTRNIVALLFTSLFAIALSINEGIQQNNFRQARGCWSHGSFKHLTEERFHELRGDPLIDQWACGDFGGCPCSPFNKSRVEIGYSDANEAHWSCCDPVEGRLPQDGTDEAATDTHVLETAWRGAGDWRQVYCHL